MKYEKYEDAWEIASSRYEEGIFFNDNITADFPSEDSAIHFKLHIAQA